MGTRTAPRRAARHGIRQADPPPLSEFD